MFSSVFELLIYSGHTGRSLAQGPAPKAKSRFLEQGPKLALGEESGKQSGAVPQGRRIGPKRCLRRTGRRTEVQAAGMPHSMDRMGMPFPPARQPEVMCDLSDNAARTGRRYDRTIPRWASCLNGRHRTHPAYRRPLCLAPAKAHVPDCPCGRHIHHSNAWSARKRTMVNPRGLTASSLFFTFSRKT